MVRIGVGAERKFADQRAAQLQYLLGELAIFARINHVNPGAEDCDGAAARLHRSPVRDRIDAAGHAANNHQAAVHQILRETLRHAETVRRRVARADHRDSHLQQNPRIAPHVKHKRRIVDLSKVRGIKLGAHGN